MSAENRDAKIEKNKRNFFIYGAVVAANLLSFIIGSAYSWSSPVIPKLQNATTSPLSRPTTTLEESWIAALLSLGAAIGPFITPFCSDRIGRKMSLILFAIPMFISYVIIAFAQTIELYYIGRLLAGIGCGGVFSILPNYVSEISESSNRGLLNCVMGLALTSGSLASFIIGPYVSIQIFCLLSLIPIIVFFITFGCFIPESPYYLIYVNKHKLAEESLKKLRKQNFRLQELSEISKSVEDCKANQSGICDLFKSKVLIKGLIVSCGLMVFQQFSGITPTLGYMQSIFEAADSALSPELSAITIGSVQFGTTLVTSQLVDRIGRNMLLLISTGGAFLSLLLLGTYFYLKNSEFDITSISWLPILSLVGFIISYNMGLGSLPWTIMGEIFPTNVKSIASSITSFVCLIVAFLITIFFPFLSENFGMAGLFWMFSLFTACAFVFVLLLVPETKGKTLQEIQVMLSSSQKK